MKKKIGIAIVTVAIVLAGIFIFIKMNNGSDNTILPKEEIHIQDGIDVEQHEFTSQE